MKNIRSTLIIGMVSVFAVAPFLASAQEAENNYPNTVFASPCEEGAVFSTVTQSCTHPIKTSTPNTNATENAYSAHPWLEKNHYSYWYNGGSDRYSTYTEHIQPQCSAVELSGNRTSVQDNGNSRTTNGDEVLEMSGEPDKFSGGTYSTFSPTSESMDY